VRFRQLCIFALILFLGAAISFYLIGVRPETFPISTAQVHAVAQDCAGRSEFRIGSGIYDITGPAAGLGMMGYAQLAQKTGGIHFRLWSRAFVVESACNGKRVVFVNTDLLAIFQAVKLEVTKRLQKKYPDGRYNEANVILSAIHNHAGPGGYSHYKLYNLTIGGFDQQNFETIVDGICQSIIRADANLSSGTIRIAQGDLFAASANRSKSAYLKNPDADPAPERDTDKLMTLLKFNCEDGTEVGMVNWFAVHCTSMHNSNRLISGDNKGYASYLFERSKNTDYNSPQTFVAAFAQSNEGDVTPNLCGGANGCGADEFENTKISGSKQFEQALALYRSAGSYLTGSVDYRHVYVKMDEVNVDGAYTGGVPQKTCPAALGLSMLAGAADGPGVGWQGLRCDKHKFLSFFCDHSHDQCQGNKPIIAKIGLKKPLPWSPNILPLQIVKIGDLVIIAVPGEFTTVSGRRLVNTVMKELAGTGIRYAVVAGLSNAYAGYVTTGEEYFEQRYEGASTHFGPWTLAAFQQEFDRLAISLREGTSLNPGPSPIDPLPTPVHVSNAEGKPFWKKYGDVRRDAKTAYQPGDRVEVTFWAGHPRNDLKIQDTFLKVERQDGALWTAIAFDRDWETRFIWRRSLYGSTATIRWNIPRETMPGIYRIRHDGAFRSHDSIVRYFGVSKPFSVGR
jgi:neutral ceramidase